MRVIYDKQVKDFLYQYESILRTKRNQTNVYARSTDRRKEKISNFRKFLQDCGSRIDSFPICDKHKLGQLFDNNGNLLNQFLKQTQYKDESQFLWRISLIKISEKVIKIYRILPANQVTEKDDKIEQFYQKLMEQYHRYWYNLFL